MTELSEYDKRLSIVTAEYDPEFTKSGTPILHRIQVDFDNKEAMMNWLIASREISFPITTALRLRDSLDDMGKKVFTYVMRHREQIPEGCLVTVTTTETEEIS